MSIVKRGKDMNALLYDLLSTRSPYGHEDNIRTIIQKFLATNKIGCEVQQDTKVILLLETVKILKLCLVLTWT